MATVKVSLTRKNDQFHFRSENDRGIVVDMDNVPAEEPGTGNGASPMQLVLMALGGCSGIDIVSILQKGRQRIDRFEMDVAGVKPDGETPSIYHDIHIRYVVDGELEPSKVRRAIDLSLDKYCSVAAILGRTAKIRYDFEVNGQAYDGSVG